MDRSPELRHAAVKLGNGRFLGQINTGDELDLGTVTERKAIGFRLIDIWHVADSAGLEQRANHRGAERSGSAGDDHMAIAIVHWPLPLLANAACIIVHGSTDARPRRAPLS